MLFVRQSVSSNVENRGIVTKGPSDQVTSDQMTKWPSDWVTKYLSDQEASQTIDRMVYFIV